MKLAQHLQPTMRKAAVSLTGVCLAAGMLFGGAAAANAANQVDCAGRTDWYILMSDTEEQCFANYGDLNMYMQYVSTISTGNNDGWVTFYDYIEGAWYDSAYRPHWYTGNFNSPVEVTWVHLR
ncbi:hypothetical protein AHiyo8_pI66940 (plasmid) [Arthrobacter sp. Hiyo8]|uniref:beta/gamma crystallin domain-containing protein n=1 Tax=Arthrobacter sp. Hiyo1 TaxID=1588020 RepID=UPI0006838650|nr:beta/gamma crystallin domain-containing protein [Arthrobacter sp. Hiyo1]BAS18390.1 hypothetical protein AHiyo8_pI66940 [Arthrobacter sp. Hiyo8]GAP61463.1 hypothetical protein AHiyo1_51670 [Arthrobacter sp. Hiyo1]